MRVVWLILLVFLVGGQSVLAAPVGQEDCDALEQKAENFFNEGLLTEMVEYLQITLICYQEMNDRRSEGRILNNMGVVYYQQELYEEALEFYQQALAIRQKVGDREGEGDTLNNIGGVYIYQEHYEKALESYKQTLAIRQEVEDRVGEGDALNNIGVIYHNQKYYREALELYQQALTISQEVGDRDGDILYFYNIGKIHFAQKKHILALEMYEQALEISQEVGDRVREGDILNNIGTVYFEQNNYELSLEFYQQALAIRQKVKDRNGEDSTLNNIGGVYFHQGRYEDALELYQQVLGVRQEIGDKEGEGSTLNNIGGVYHRQGRYEDALSAFQQALAISQEVGDREGEGSTLNNIGGVYHRQGRYEDALSAFQQALATRQEVGDREGEGRSLHSIGAIYYLQEQYRESLGKFQKALVINREGGDKAGEATNLTHIGWVYLKQEDYELALKSIQQSINLFDEIRSTAGNDQARSSYIAQYADLYDSTVFIYHLLNQPDQAFFTSEQNRARSFMDALATGHVQLDDNDMVDLYNQEQSLYSQRQAVQDNLAKAKAREDTDLISELESQLAELEEQYSAIQADIQARDDQLSDLVPGRTSDNLLTVEKVQPYLSTDSTLVMYHVLEENVLVFLLTPTSFETVLLEVSPDDLKQTIQQFREFNDVEASLVQLHKWLIVPLKDKLTTPHLTIIPHQTLHYLPFAALTDGEKYLIDEYTLTTLPSASVLPYVLDSAKNLPASSELAGSSVLVLGNPTTGDYDGLGSLPYAEAEAQTIADLYGIEPLLNEQATETALRERAEQASIIHLAAHGKYNPVAPLSSLIALAPDEQNDGWLTVGEVFGLPLGQTELVVLSACESHVGQAGLRTGLGVSAGDDIVGLNRAFIFAGAPSIMSSLWPVEDEATSQLMTEFYSNLRNGLGKAESLRQAQLTMREAYPNPYYWAAFVLAGDGGESAEQPIATATLQKSTSTPAPVAQATPKTEAPTITTPPIEADNSGGWLWYCCCLGCLWPASLMGVFIAWQRVMMGGV
ncbi:tetratricopeptide repeat protein [Anaerolineales bacterium HSG24]|nr:tetratricopeptide repeat protein [Anaerolineales bacterium HSG24]